MASNVTVYIFSNSDELLRHAILVEEWFSDFDFLPEFLKLVKWLLILSMFTTVVVGLTSRIIIAEHIIKSACFSAPINMMLFVEQLAWIICYTLTSSAMFLTLVTRIFVKDLLGPNACNILLVFDAFPPGFIILHNLLISIFRILVYKGFLQDNTAMWIVCISFELISLGFGGLVSYLSFEGLAQNYAESLCYGKSLDHCIIEHAYRGSRSFVVEIVTTFGIMLALSLIVYIWFFASLYRHDERMRRMMSGQEIDGRHRRNGVSFIYQLHHFVVACCLLTLFASVELLSNDPQTFADLGYLFYPMLLLRVRTHGLIGRHGNASNQAAFYL